MKFTGHERDLLAGGDTMHAMDYMHARYYLSNSGRFVSVDPGPSDLRRPQTWHRYNYAENNPMLKVDRNGKLTNPVTCELGRGKPILHGGGSFGEIRELKLSVRGSAGGEYGADRSGGRTHRGVDIVAPGGTPIVASFSGTVSEVRQPGKDNKLGLTVVVVAKDNTTAMYAHMSDATVKPGDTVKEGEKVGDAGRTGNVTASQPASGDHLHFQIYDDKGALSDPEQFLNDPKNQKKYRDKEKEKESQP